MQVCCGASDFSYKFILHWSREIAFSDCELFIYHIGYQLLAFCCRFAQIFMHCIRKLGILYISILCNILFFYKAIFFNYWRFGLGIGQNKYKVLYIFFLSKMAKCPELLHCDV